MTASSRYFEASSDAVSTPIAPQAAVIGSVGVGSVGVGSVGVGSVGVGGRVGVGSGAGATPGYGCHDMVGPTAVPGIGGGSAALIVVSGREDLEAHSSFRQNHYRPYR